MINGLIGLKTRATRVCLDMGISCKDDLRRFCDSKLLKHRSCGRKTLNEIRVWSGTQDRWESERLVALCDERVKYLEKRGFTIVKPSSGIYAEDPS